jgi:hypothetical protein
MKRLRFQHFGCIQRIGELVKRGVEVLMGVLKHFLPRDLMYVFVTATGKLWKTTNEISALSDRYT